MVLWPLCRFDHCTLNYCILKKKMSYFCCIAEIFKVEKMVMCMMNSKWIWVQGFYLMATYWNNCFVILHIVKLEKLYLLTCRNLHNCVRQKLLKLTVFRIPERSAKIEVLRATFVFCDVTTEEFFSARFPFILILSSSSTHWQLCQRRFCSASGNEYVLWLTQGQEKWLEIVLQKTPSKYAI